MNQTASAPAGAILAIRSGVAQSLAGVIDALKTSAANPQSAMAAARVRWQEAHAALRVADHKGMVRFSEELGAFIASVPDGLSISERTGLVSRACDALLGFMGHVAAGQPDRPLRLFPVYRELLRGRGVEQAYEGDLYFPDLTLGPPNREDAVALSVDDLRALRRRLEMGLLQWLRKPGDGVGLQEIHAVLGAVEASRSAGRDRALWWSAQALVEAVSNGGLDADNRLRRLFNQINLQLGKIIQGNGDIAEALLREVLYHVARAKAVTPLVAAVQLAYRLQGSLEAEVTASGTSQDALAAAQARFSGMHDAWSGFACGEGDIAAFRTRVREFATVCKGLANADLDALLQQVDANVSAVAGDPKKLTDAAALEVACALLVIERALDADALTDTALPIRIRNMVARLAASLADPQSLKSLPPAEFQSEASRRSESVRLMQQVYTEVGIGLRKVEPVLDAYFREPAKYESLNALDTPLAQSAGALAMLGEPEAAALLQQCRINIAGFATGSEGSPDDHALLAQRLTALAAYVDVARRGPADLRAILEQAGLVQPVVSELVSTGAVGSSVSERIAVRETVPAASVQAEQIEPAEVANADVALDGGSEADPDMLAVFLDEAGEVLSAIDAALPASRSDPENQEHLVSLRRSFHTLKGSGRMVGLKHFGEAAWEVEQVMNARAQEKLPGTPALYGFLGYASECFRGWVMELRTSGRTAIDATRLADWAGRLRAGEPLLPQMTESAAADEPQDLVIGDVRVTRKLYDIYITEARQHANVLRQKSDVMRVSAAVPDFEFVKSAHTLAGTSGTVGFKPLQELASSLERLLFASSESRRALGATEADVLGQAVAACSEMVAAIGAGTVPSARPDLVAALDALVLSGGETAAERQQVKPELLPSTVLLQSGSMVEAEGVAHIAPTESGGSERRRYRLEDDVDEQLLPVFLAEAQELVPQIGQDLRDWRARPDDKLIPQSLKRLLHTLKGSSRMAGAMGLGELTHRMETRVENALLLPAVPESLFDQLEGSFDRIGILVEKLQGVEARTIAAKVQPSPPTAASLPEPEPAAAPPTAVVPAEAAQRALLRVRADMMDRLSNQMGEVSIARARIESELRSLRASMRDLTESISKLRGQLREIELQADTQMQSRMAHAPEARGDFDPLEFDRFTRLQELTRLMAESVNDVATLHQNLMRDLEQGEAALHAQARMNREMQQELLAIRMMPFFSLSDRLYRVTRLAAKDAGKRVNLDIKGGHVELDRGMLDRITAPFEHMLRNAVVHGIEDPERRRRSGKPEAGEILIEVRQEGNEVVIMLRDDGAGLDIDHIREKAIERGLMRNDDVLTDRQIGEFIFQAGLSTAEHVSEVAGRGVGMDVVRNEINALGGRVEFDSERGVGIRFTIRLPLTLAVLQAVVLRAGGNLYAVPALMVEQVQKIRGSARDEIDMTGQVNWQNHEYPFRVLRKLLGLPPALHVDTRTSALLLLRSGQDRAAVEVDDLIGGQEIVVKNIGSQLARVPGVTGAALLGSGEMVLILNPVILAQRWVEAPQAKAVTPAVPMPDMTQIVARVPSRQKTVMVVDDSLTVRKITGRLLTREGYAVITAKDGIEALEKIQDAVPDVVLTDVEMPRMDGFDLTRNLRSDAVLRDLPIIMITSRTADKHREHATGLGVNVFLGKPYEEGELLRHIAVLASEPLH